MFGEFNTHKAKCKWWQRKTANNLPKELRTRNGRIVKRQALLRITKYKKLWRAIFIKEEGCFYTTINTVILTT